MLVREVLTALDYTYRVAVNIKSKKNSVPLEFLGSKKVALRNGYGLKDCGAAPSNARVRSVASRDYAEGGANSRLNICYCFVSFNFPRDFYRPLKCE